ncbi:MAG TPA: PQQ-binding-like beta-propeller repeat protein, partial [Acidimicrobiales bacterium]|nr:PQQ-binding-like beta-propeller repeat protein [Acidimicrobiales bacterium]
MTQTSLAPPNVAGLKQQWHLRVSAPISAQPIVYKGIIYWGDWNGNMHATTLSGKTLWSTSLGITPKPPACPYPLVKLGIESTPTIGFINGQTVVWVGGGAGQLVALNASNGSVIWQTHLATEVGDAIWSSPAYYRGSLYVGVASFQGCPQEFGRIVRVSAATGAVQSAINFASLVPARCKGPGAWSSPSVDATSNSIFIDTSNDLCNSRYQDGILKLNPSTLAITSSWQVPISQHPADSDMGASPMLFTATIGGVQRQLVGAVNKNGVYYVLDRNDLAAGPIWQYRVESQATFAVGLGPLAHNCNNTISTSGWAGGSSPIIVAGVALNSLGNGCIGTLTALDPATGNPEWQINLEGGVEGAVTEAPGLVLIGAGTTFDVLSPTDGATLFSYTEPVSKPITGLYGAPTSWFWAPPTVSGDVVLAA